MPNTASKTAGRNGTRAGTGNRTQRTGGTRPRAGAAAVRDDEQETKSQYGGAEGNEKALAYISDYILNGGKDTKEAWEHAKTLDPTYTTSTRSTPACGARCAGNWSSAA